MTERGTRQIMRNEMLPLIVGPCPSFGPIWREFLDNWESEPGELPYYVALGDLAHHLIERLDRGQTSSFPEIFQVVEDWHLHGEHYVREAATIGLLEGIQNLSGGDSQGGRSRAGHFEKWLGPESLQNWNKLYEFWNRITPARQDD